MLNLCRRRAQHRGHRCHSNRRGLPSKFAHNAVGHHITRFLSLLSETSSRDGTPDGKHGDIVACVIQHVAIRGVGNCPFMICTSRELSESEALAGQIANHATSLTHLGDPDSQGEELAPRCSSIRRYYRWLKQRGNRRTAEPRLPSCQAAAWAYGAQDSSQQTVK